MEIALNGQTHQVPEGATVATMLQQLGIDARRVAVEVNVTIIKRSAYETTVLRPGDRVEVVHLVGGGADRRLTCVLCLVSCVLDF